MRSLIDGARALAYEAFAQENLAKKDMGGDEEAQRRVAFLTPLVKLLGTEIGVEVASRAMQVHGGTGFIRGTGVEQYLRDVRITPIYEGTNGIQAIDFVGRKMMGDKFSSFHEWIQFAWNNVQSKKLTDLLEKLDIMVGRIFAEPEQVPAIATPLTHAFALAAAGVMQDIMLQQSKALHEQDPLRKRVELSHQFFMNSILPRASALLDEVANQSREEIKVDLASSLEALGLELHRR
jgi:acyl-CoA dehydrogenase